VASQIQVLINALWQGKGETQQARGDVQGLGGASAEAAIRMAAAEARSRDLASTLRDLGQKVSSGKLTVEQATDAWEQYQAQLKEIPGAANAAGDAVEKSGQGAQSSGLKWANAAGALYTVQTAYQTARRAAEEVYETIREGAELDWGERKFENLARSIGATSDELLGAMEANTRGLLSQADTMGMAADLIGLRLVDTVEEAARLSGVVAGLGMDLNQLTLTLTNQTTMRFDQLGVAVGGFDEKLKALEAQGLATDKAFLWAFIQQAEESMERSGSRADTLAGKLDVLEAAAADSFASFKQGLAEVAEPFIDWLASSIVEAQNAAAAIRDLRDAIDELGGDSAAVERAKFRATAVVGQAVEDAATFLGAPVGLRTREEVKQLAILLTEGTRSVAEQEAILQHYGFTVDDIGFKLRGLGVSWVELNKELRDLARSEAVRQHYEDIEQMTAAYRRRTEAAGDYTTTLERLGQMGRDAVESEQAAWFREVEERIEMRARHMALLNAETTDYVYTLEELSRMSREGVDTLELQTRATAELAEAARALDTVYAGDFRRALEGAEEETTSLNTALFEQLTALGAAPDTLRAAALATGEWTDEQIKAAIRAAALEKALRLVADEVAAGNITVSEGIDFLRDYEKQLQEDYRLEVDVEDIDEAKRQARELQAQMNALERLYTLRVRIQQEGGIPMAPPGGLPGSPPFQFDDPTLIPPGNAAGTSFFPGGLTWVGEQGPELVALPRGSRIWSNLESERIAAGMGGDSGTHNEYHISLIIEGRRSDLPTEADDAESFLAAARKLGVPV